MRQFRPPCVWCSCAQRADVRGNQRSVMKNSPLPVQVSEKQATSKEDLFHVTLVNVCGVNEGKRL